MQEMGNYPTHTQHTPLDTFDQVVGADLIQGAQVMAVAAWGLLNGERMPHQKPAARQQK